MVEPTPLKNMLVKLDHFPKFRGEHKKYLSCNHPNNQYNQPTSKVSNQPLRFHIHTPSPCYSRLHGGFHGHGTSLTAASCQGNGLGRMELWGPSKDSLIPRNPPVTTRIIPFFRRGYRDPYPVGGFNPFEKYYVVKLDHFPKDRWRWK